jgi:hypothetical protein
MSKNNEKKQKRFDFLGIRFQIVLFVIGLLMGLVCVFIATGWFQKILLVLVTVCFIGGYFSSNIKDAGPD